MSSGVRADHAVISAPTQNALSPAAVRIAQRTAGLASSRVAYSPRASIISSLNALSFSGRFSVTVAMASSTVRMTSSGMLFLRELETERRILEQRRIHRLQICVDSQRELGEIEHIALQIDAR